MRRPKGLAFFMDPGCGKTKAVLDTIAIRALRGECKRVLVTCPLGAISVWEDEIEEHFPFSYSVKTPDEPSYKVLQGPLGVSFFLINYELWRQRHRDRRGGWVYPWVKAFEKWAPDIVVSDESHRAKSTGSVTAQALWRSVERMRRRRASNGSPWVYLMSGTPHPKGWQDLFAQFRILDPDLFGTAFADFAEEYLVYGQQPHNKFTVIRYNNLDELKRIVKENSYIISKAKALPWLPEQRWQNIKVALPPDARGTYNEMAEELVADIEGEGVLEAANAGVRRLRLQQITGGFTTDGTVIHRAKLNRARELLEDYFAQHESIIVYARFLPEVHALGEVAEKIGYETYTIYGKVKKSDRTHARRRFQKPGSTPVALVFQVATGSLAITLTAGANVLYYSLPDSWEHYYQSQQRVHRPGQNRGVLYRHLISPGTVDVATLANLRNKASMHAALMGDPAAFVYGGEPL